MSVDNILSTALILAGRKELYEKKDLYFNINGLEK